MRRQRGIDLRRKGTWLKASQRAALDGQAMPQLDVAAIFTLLFVTLGPVKLLAPFARATREIDEQRLKHLALLTFVVGICAVLAGSFIGKSLMGSWRISAPAITLAGALIFLLVGLQAVLAPYSSHTASDPDEVLSAKPITAAFQLTFPTVVTPYGLAAAIALLAGSSEFVRTIEIVTMLVVIMVINLLAMHYIRRIMGTVVIMMLQLFGAVLAVLQVALAVQLILRALQPLGIVE